MTTGLSSVPPTGTGGMHPPHALKNETGHRKHLLDSLQKLGNILDGQHPYVG
jgi:hypothetical protein